jgi:hypothetical protein
MEIQVTPLNIKLIQVAISDMNLSANKICDGPFKGGYQ